MTNNKIEYIPVNKAQLKKDTSFINVRTENGWAYELFTFDTITTSKRYRNVTLNVWGEKLTMPQFADRLCNFCDKYVEAYHKPISTSDKFKELYHLYKKTVNDVESQIYYDLNGQKQIAESEVSVDRRYHAEFVTLRSEIDELYKACKGVTKHPDSLKRLMNDSAYRDIFLNNLAVFCEGQRDTTAKVSAGTYKVKAYKIVEHTGEPAEDGEYITMDRRCGTKVIPDADKVTISFPRYHETKVVADKRWDCRICNTTCNEPDDLAVIAMRQKKQCLIAYYEYCVFGREVRYDPTKGENVPVKMQSERTEEYESYEAQDNSSCYGDDNYNPDDLTSDEIFAAYELEETESEELDEEYED